MKLPAQPRTSAFRRSTAALALAGFTAVSLAQAPAAKGSDKPSKPISEILTTSQRTEADNAYLTGARLFERKDFAGAETQFQKAAKLNPSDHNYALAANMAHTERVTDLLQQAGKARLAGQQKKADSLLAEARQLDPENDIVPERSADSALAHVFRPEAEPWLRQAPELAGPIVLAPNASSQSFHIHTNEQQLIRQVFQTYGIRPVFDESVSQQSLRFDIDDVHYTQASSILLSMAHLFSVPLDATSVLIAKDTPDNRQRFERQLQETIYVPAATSEEIDSLGNVIRQVFGVKQLTVAKESGDLVLRAPADTLKAVNLTLHDLLDNTDEVMIELRLYTVDTTRQRQIGGQTPQQIGVYSVASEAQQIVSQNQTLVNQAIAQGLVPANASNVTIALALIASGLVQSTLVSNTIGLFGGGLTASGVTENQGAAFHLALNSSDTRGLDDMQVRVSNRQTATFRIGTRYPITTATYTNGISGISSSALAGVNVNGVPASQLLSQLGTQATIPEIQYEDLGLTLKAVPSVQKSGNITMQIDLKIESLAGTSSNNIPILNNHSFISDVTVPDGETAVLASSVTRSESAAIDGLPGLGELPGFQTLTSDKTAEKDTSELLLLITPHVVRKRHDLIASPPVVVNLPQDSD
ncbi:hypothetical protein GCM10011507_13060 [Edaphobacter acidisoli]|uniref:Type II/III secretion system secretin-like domain-containing protein n=1 Tax=Edaphobacter acidisoli TaxID=2040573 RepID=A0A916RND4_9BACT|nr:hypothetical protein [Edaphobacter acidisoli]GGA62843.1 hypothetical protein GCM10011507_13060 [Edaphobacter acidisoli]